MADETPHPPPAPVEAPPGVPPEISTQEIDDILREEDPTFAASLEEVKQAAPEGDVVIESIDVGDPDAELAGPEAPEENISFVQRLKGMRPVEVLKYLLSVLLGALKSLGSIFSLFRNWSWEQRLGFLFFLAILGAASVLVVLNLKGRWMPEIDKPILDDIADEVDRTYPAKEVSWVPLYDALRQPGHRYLFDRFVVNLTRTHRDLSENPMGLFEFFVELDSNKAAVEVKTRDLELRDFLQRTIEGETYESLSGEQGKEKLKNLIRSELNQILQEGAVEGVYISKLVLKP